LTKKAVVATADLKAFLYDLLDVDAVRRSA
jgi:hypothetical protein